MLPASAVQASEQRIRAAFEHSGERMAGRKVVVSLAPADLRQEGECALLCPHSVGSNLELPGLWLLAAVLIGGGMMGISGMVLFVPRTAALYRLVGEWVRRDPRLVKSAEEKA